jgi:hypothetical protein
MRIAVSWRVAAACNAVRAGSVDVVCSSSSPHNGRDAVFTASTPQRPQPTSIRRRFPSRDDVIRRRAIRLRRRRVRGSVAAARRQRSRVPLLQQDTGTHFYTTSVSERDGIIAYYPQFAYEGPAFHALPIAGPDGRTAVYRFFNKTTGAHSTRLPPPSATRSSRPIRTSFTKVSRSTCIPRPLRSSHRW